MSVSDKTYFKVYQKYLEKLTDEEADSIDINMDEGTRNFINEKAEEFGVSVDAIIDGYLQQYVFEHGDRNESNSN